MDTEKLVQPNEDWTAAGWTEDQIKGGGVQYYDDWLDYVYIVLNDFFDYMDEGGYFG